MWAGSLQVDFLKGFGLNGHLMDSFLWLYLLRVFGYCDVAYSFLFSTEAFVMSKERCDLIRNS